MAMSRARDETLIRVLDIAQAGWGVDKHTLESMGGCGKSARACLVHAIRRLRFPAASARSLRWQPFPLRPNGRRANEDLG